MEIRTYYSGSTICGVMLTAQPSSNVLADTKISELEASQSTLLTIRSHTVTKFEESSKCLSQRGEVEYVVWLV